MARRYQISDWASPNALGVLIAYVLAIGAAVLVVANLAERDARTAIHGIEAVATLPILGESTTASTTPRVLRSIAGETRNMPVSVESDAFPHARPAPMLFERLSPQEIAEMKKESAERIVADDATPWHHGDSQTYKTMCVRLCDGAYFPISFATTRRHFAKDEAQCAARCGSPARLFVFPNPGGNPDMMRDRSGHSYLALPTAFQYRRGPVSGCSCKAEPWEQASRERHELYALEAELAGGKAVDTAELLALRQKLADADGVALSRKTAAGTNLYPSTTLALRDESGHQVRDDMKPGVADQAWLTEPIEARASIPPLTMATRVPALVSARVTNPETENAVLDMVEQLPPGTSAAKRADESASSAELPPLPTKSDTERADAQSATSLTSGSRSQRGKTASRQVVRSLSGSTPKGNGLAEQTIWGVGPNAYDAPRGTSARDTFARNFF